MAVWSELETRHLPMYVPNWISACNWFRPGMSDEELIQHIGYKPSRCTTMPFHGENPAEEIWALSENPAVSEYERIALYTTFDYALVRRDELPRVIEAFRGFGGETSLPEQADILQKMFDDPDVIAVGWNQTSVSAHAWDSIGGDGAVGAPYNCLTMRKHFWIFDELCKE